MLRKHSDIILIEIILNLGLLTFLNVDPSHFIHNILNSCFEFAVKFINNMSLILFDKFSYKYFLGLYVRVRM